MADKRKHATEGIVNYVAQDRFWRDAMEKEFAIQTRTWPDKWRYLVDEYKKMNDELDQGERGPLPQKILTVKNDFRPFEPKPENIRPVPPAHTKMYGWKVDNSILMPTYSWIKPATHRLMHKQLSWPEDHQW